MDQITSQPQLKLPEVREATLLEEGVSRCYVGAYGFEERSLGWTAAQKTQGKVIQQAVVFRYSHAKGKNRIRDLRRNLKLIGAKKIVNAPYDVWAPHNIEELYDDGLVTELAKFDEVVFDTSAMTKFLILVSLVKLDVLRKRIRIVYTEAETYAPSREDFKRSKKQMRALTRFPNQGFGSIFRARCLSSVRMQGQPVTVVAFTSFNEQLIRHMLGTISPHRLVLINGRPPRPEFRWREHATQEIHGRLVEDFSADNPLDRSGSLVNVVSTLDYRETVDFIESIYKKIGMHERIIVAATGSKMQTIGLFIAKALHPDIHVEYPTPDSYFISGMSEGVRKEHEVKLESLSSISSR